MEFSLELGTRQQLEHRASPSLVAFSQILQLDGVALQQLVRENLEQNPALELVERELCRLCGRPLRRGICTDCLRREAREPADEGRASERDGDFDPLASVAAPRSLAEVMLEALALSVPREDFYIGEYLVGSLDEHAFLPADIVGEVVRTLNVTPERARGVLAALQRSGAAGVGARSVRECLLLQLERLEARGEADPLARRIVTGQLEELGRGRHVQIARALGVTVAEVTQARDFIRRRLRPFVVSGSETTESWASSADRGYVIPDILIREDSARPGEFLVEVAESRRAVVRVSAAYRRLAEALVGESSGGNGAGGAGSGDFSATDCEHILKQVAHAQQFIGHLRQRQSTLRRVAEAVVALQKRYLRAGVRQLAPLTRHQVAAALELHESTVSRAVADKYVSLPWRETVAFSQFFEAARAVQDVLRELIVSECEPHSDDQLALQLAERGYPLARRTVAKYRNRMGVLPSTLR
jgi:RNA polymerase sigma-54 factor